MTLVLLLNVTQTASAGAGNVERQAAPRVGASLEPLTPASRLERQRPPLIPIQRLGRSHPHHPLGILFSRLRIRVTAVTDSSIAVAWSGWRGAAYRIFKDGIPVGWTSDGEFAYTGLSCDTSYMLGVVAFPAHGRSPVAAVAIGARTSACPLPPPDTASPSSPGNVHIAATTESSITIAWDASQDDVGVAGYGVYNGVTPFDSTSATSYTFVNLACATGYSFAVDAYDAAGNRSPAAGVEARTDDCPPPADTEAPTAPGNVHATVTTASSITVAWDPSTDNVALAGYGVYIGVTRVDTTTAASYTFEKLACDTVYTLAVDAYDAAGNRSATAAVDATTASCPIAEPQPIAGQGYRLAFGDEFDSLDRAVWDDHIWYDDPPSPTWAPRQYVSAGTLQLVSRRDDLFPGCTSLCYPINTATTLSSGKSFQYGYFEARMRWTKGPGSWPAFWLISTGWAKTGSCATPAGELDVMEGQGTEPDVFYGTIHKDSAGACGGDEQNGNNWQPVGVDLTDGFHTYAALWTPTTVSWYLDDKLIMSAPTYSTDNQPMFLLLQMWSGGWTSPPTSATPPELLTEIDWVHVWQK